MNVAFDLFAKIDKKKDALGFFSYICRPKEGVKTLWFD